MRTPPSGCHPLTKSLALATLALAALSAARADYPTLIESESPKAYYRLNDSTARTLINKNSGTLGAAGNASNDLASVTFGVVHPFPGAIAGDPDRAEFFDFTTRTEIPFNPALNTPNTQPFTVEAWMYPVNDQDTTSFGGMGALANRWTQGGNRQGWVMYQRRPNANYSTAEGQGWEFRMYNDLDGSGHLDVVSQVPFQLGQWQHVVVVYEPIGGDPTNSTLTIYIDGVPANTNINTAAVPGYGPCTGDHSPAPNGQPAMSLGGYNNANSGTYGFSNPWIGGVDEYAWYPTNLTPAQILAHYQNATNANRTQSYSSLILSHHPAAYLRLNDIASGADVAVNLGGLSRDAGGGTGGATGLGTHTAEVRHPAAGAVASDKKSGATAYHNRNGKSTTNIPYDAENNGKDPISGVASAGTPFTFEAWFRPLKDTQGGQAPVNNRYVNSGHRTGWVIYQRNPNLSYPASEGHGWNFRMYDGYNSSVQDILTGSANSNVGDYTVGKWQHLVVTWEPVADQGDIGGFGNDTWLGTLTGYVDGQPVVTNENIFYAANTNPTEDATLAADFAVGSYNAASTLGNNAFEGDVGDLALYNNYVLTPDQILAHYQAGTNSNYGTNYATLVMTAAAELSSFVVERTTLPATYLRFNDPASYPAANSGALGYVADGNLVLTTNIAVGPQPPTYPGFEASNPALPLDGVKQWASFNNPSGLNISGQITLEAWVKPAATQGAVARIISHGPQTLSSFLGQDLQGAITNSTEVFLRVDGSGTDYSVGSATYDDATATTTTHAATFPVPAADLGSSAWVHLVGVYDGANWKLYRNGVLVATQASAVGALPVDLGDWAIGSTGNGWADAFAGTVDEVAIYGYALTANQIAGHFNAGTAAPRLTITRSGSNVIITWPYGPLYQADNVTGPWTLVPGNPASPYTVSASAARKFYRF
jgi:hypothetical protein